MGSLLLSIELLPKDLAESVPVGMGRSEPNLNPYLPPPTGRMTFRSVSESVSEMVFLFQIGT